MPVTTQGKEKALKALQERREANRGKEQIDNSSLRAGSPMYYYCISCGGLADTLVENWSNKPKKLCYECQALKDLGWLE